MKTATLDTSWADDRFVTKSAYDALAQDERALIDSDPNKWEWDWASERYYNAQHPANDEWLQQRQMMESRAVRGL